MAENKMTNLAETKSKLAMGCQQHIPGRWWWTWRRRRTAGRYCVTELQYVDRQNTAGEVGHTLGGEVGLAAAVDCKQSRKGPRQLEDHQTPRLKCQTCNQLSTTLCNRQVVVDLELTGLMDAGNQQAVGLYNPNFDRQQC